MLKNYLFTALRILSRQKGYSLLNIAGLAVGLSVCILILRWVQDELSFDRFHQHSDAIYRVTSDCQYWEGYWGTPAPLALVVLEAVPEVESASRIATVPRKVFRAGGNVFYEDDGLLVDPAFFEMFTFPFIHGDQKSALLSPDNIVITERMARKYFGDDVPVGAVIDVEGKTVTVAGVLEDVPHNSHLQFDFLCPFQYLDQYAGWGTGWGSFNFATYLQLKNGTDIQDVGRKITELATEHDCPQIVRGNGNFHLQPLLKIHLDGRFKYSYGLIGDSRYAYGLSLIAFFILLVGCINFINLSTARSAARSREIGIRKTAGANRTDLIKQFLSESFVLTWLAALLSIGLVEMALPSFNQFAGKELTLNFKDFQFLGVLLLLVLFTGMAAGSYPAFFLSAFKPSAILRSSPFALKAAGRKGFYRKILVVFQFTVSLILIIGTLAIYSQMNYIRNKELGFDKESIVYIPIKGEIGAKYTTVKEELLNYHDIVAVSAQDYLSATLCNRTTAYGWEGKTDEQSVDMIVSAVDYDFFRTLNMDLVAGRPFSTDHATDPEQAFILNEEAVRQTDLDDPVGKEFSYYDKKGFIIGVARNAHLRSLHNRIEPHVFHLLSDAAAATQYGVVLIKIRGGNIPKTLSVIEAAWSRVNQDSPFEYHFLDQTYEKLYRTEQQIGSILKYATVIAIFVCCLGLFGLASFSAQRRTKEIGIRKVLGASVPGLAALLSREYLVPVLLANLIAWPIAYYVINLGLHHYAYRIELNLWLFAAAGLLALVITMATVSFQAFRAATSNPVKSLRYE